MNNISSVSACVNCGSCLNSCPENAVYLETEGLFYMPRVNNAKCVSCGICLRRCPVENPPVAGLPVSAFGGWSKSPDLVQNSSSGGIFGQLAKKITDRGGTVFGAAFSDDFRSVTIQSTDKTELINLQKSKYAESLTGDSFKLIKDLLNRGKEVLYCSTPCQIAGLYSFLGGGDERLVTVDFACGGLPSHKIFQEYLTELENKFRSSIVSVDFRPKTHGWERHSVLIRFANGKSYNRLGTEDNYMRCFLYGKLTVRESCTHCRFSCRHASDITLADFWLYKKLSSLNNENGISLILCNTEKGERYLKEIEPQISVNKLDVHSASYNNVEASFNAAEQERRNRFLSVCKEKGFSAACGECEPRSFKERAKSLAVRYRCRKQHP